MATFRVLVFGSAGVGKTSLCNALTGEAKPVGASVNGTTFCSYTYKPMKFGNDEIVFTDTMGLNESDRGSNPSAKALEELTRLLRQSPQGFNLLIHVMKMGRIDAAHENNYELFVRQIAGARIPTVLVATHCENVEPMSKWVKENQDHISRRRLQYRTIVATSFGEGGRFADIFTQLRKESREALCNAITACAEPEPVVLYEGPSDFLVLVRRIWLWLVNNVFAVLGKAAINIGVYLVLTQLGVPHADATQLAKASS